MDDLANPAVVADLALAAIVAETAILAALPRLGFRAPDISRLAPNLVSGGLILLSLRFSRTSLPAIWTVAPLALALLAHVVDLRMRWHRDS